MDFRLFFHFLLPNIIDINATSAIVLRCFVFQRSKFVFSFFFFLRDNCLHHRRRRHRCCCRLTTMFFISLTEYFELVFRAQKLHSSNRIHILCDETSEEQRSAAPILQSSTLSLPLQLLLLLLLLFFFYFILYPKKFITFSFDVINL